MADQYVRYITNMEYMRINATVGVINSYPKLIKHLNLKEREKGIRILSLKIIFPGLSGFR